VFMVGKNPLMSHHSPQARRFWPKFSKDPHNTLVVVDPRLSETAKLADIHLTIKPGTDALLLRAMISIILKEGWQDRGFIDEHVSGFDAIRPLFEDFDPKAAIDVCELDFEQIKKVCRLFTTRKSCYISDLGVLMTRHSTLISWLESVFLSVTGRFSRKGGNRIPSGIGRPRQQTSEEWKTVITGFPAITGIYPPNVIPEEILNEHPDRLRAIVVSACNPMRSYADTSAYEEAFGKLELLVTVEIAMTETAALSHYVLPALSGYESWDGAGMQFRRPVVKPVGDQLEGGEIFARLADTLGFVPDIPDSLYAAAESGDRQHFDDALTAFLQDNPGAGSRMPYILARTLGKNLGSVHLAALWGRLRMMVPKEDREKAYQAVLDQSARMQRAETGGQAADDEAFPKLPTDDGRIRLNVPEMTEWLQQIEPNLEKRALEEGKDQHPLILSSGRHFDYNANTHMRDPEWNKGKRACTLIMHPEDAEKQQLEDGQMVTVVTEAGQETVELEIDPTTRPGYTMIPHGFGLVHQGEKHGPNANLLAKNTHRDPIAGTPLHRYIRCRVEAA